MPCPSLHYSFKKSKIIFVQCEIIQCYIETGLPKRFIFVWMTEKGQGGERINPYSCFIKELTEVFILCWQVVIFLVNITILGG